MDRKVYVTLYKFVASPAMIVVLVVFYLASLSTIFGVQDGTIKADHSATNTTEKYKEKHTVFTALAAENRRSQRNLKGPSFTETMPVNYTHGDIDLFFEVIKIRKRQNISSNALKEEILKAESSSRNVFHKTLPERSKTAEEAVESTLLPANVAEMVQTTPFVLEDATLLPKIGTTAAFEEDPRTMVSVPDSQVLSKVSEASLGILEDTTKTPEVMETTVLEFGHVTSAPEITTTVKISEGVKNILVMMGSSPPLASGVLRSMPKTVESPELLDPEVLNNSLEMVLAPAPEGVSSGIMGTPEVMTNVPEIMVTPAALSPYVVNSEMMGTPEVVTNASETRHGPDTVGDVPEMMVTPASLVVKPPPGKKIFHLGDPLMPPEHGCPEFCHVGSDTSIGFCTTADDCEKRGGTSAGSCCGAFFICCTIRQYCGDTSSERLVSFQSADYPNTSHGSTACDFDLLIQQDVCAVRIDFVHARFHGKIGGICDVDQVLIINSVDGPTSAQCGDLSGYSTTVAVTLEQEKPLKIVIIAQNEGYYLWNIRLRQIPCTDLKHFKKPLVCGSKVSQDSAVSFYQLLDLWRNKAWHASSQYTDSIWWREPVPAYNRFYYGTTKKALLQGPQLQDLAEDRIIGGNEADLHEFPWQVAIVLKRVFFCGGSLINDEYVLSAAHCFLTQDTPVADLIVFLGDHDLTSSSDTINDIRGVKQVHFHAHFHALLLSNDIAMLQLDRPVAFSQRIRPVCLPHKNLAVIGSTGKVAGWGITAYPNGKPNAVLQKLEVQVMSNEFCENALNEDLGPGNLCAVPRGHQGTCFGDSGGPLTISRNSKETLIGIVSFGIAGCAVTPGLPDLYTRVSEYLQWIDISSIKNEE